MICEKEEIADNRTVLFVDDDEIVLRSIKRGFLDEPYNQLFANSGQEALEILQKEDVHVIVTDIIMPNMDGVELIKIIREKYPHIVKIVLSGYTDMAAFQKEFSQGEIFRFICKPWKLEVDFIKVVSQAIDQYNSHNKHDTALLG
jgi:two-component system response regulator HupR/HoxA